MAVVKLENPETMTIREARKKYSKKYIGIKVVPKFFLTSIDDDECTVYYLADTYIDSALIPSRSGLTTYPGYGVTDFPGGSIRVSERLVEEE